MVGANGMTLRKINPNARGTLIGQLSLMEIVLICGDTHFTKFLNQRQDVSFSFPKIAEMSLMFYWE